MSLFNRDPTPSPRVTPAKAPEPSTAGERGNKLTHVARGSRIKGLISGSTEVFIEGEVEGEIQLDGRLVVGRQGKVLGNVKARAIEVAGHVAGNLHGLDRVELGASASLEGDVLAPRVLIAEGAFFQGRIEMKGDASRPSKKVEVPRSLVATERQEAPAEVKDRTSKQS